jgi:hypothetical protein
MEIVMVQEITKKGKLIMKMLTILILGMLTSMNVYASGRFVSVEYKHSRRIQYNEIVIELGSENNNDKLFYAKLLTKNIEQENENFITERVISIEKEYFDDIYNIILELNLKEIIKSYENMVGADGFTVSITVGTRQNNIKTTLWRPDSSTTESEKFRIIIYELFSLFDMQEWL